MAMHLGQLMMIGLRGTSLTAEEEKFIVENDISGVTLFDRNLKSPEQIHALCSHLQKLRHKTRSGLPFFIAIDMEGGRVHRFKAPFTKWPALKHLGDKDSPTLAFDFALGMGQELKAVGVNLDFAPCLDIFTNPANQIIGDRSPGTTADMVAKIGSALTRGYLKSGIIPCGKHFPGHGNTLLDSHFDLPVEDNTWPQLLEREIIPFTKNFRSGVPMVMTAHILFKNIDPKNPVTLSSLFLKTYLRQELRYQGIIISDDLDMKALADKYDPERIPTLALQAGCDMILYCNDFDRPELALDSIHKSLAEGQLQSSALQQSLDRVTNLKKEYLQNPDPDPFEKSKAWVGHPDHLALVEKIINP